MTRPGVPLGNRIAPRKLSKFKVARNNQKKGVMSLKIP
jgi:hypothetical protein